MAEYEGHRVSSDYGPRSIGDGFHDGVDLDTSDAGEALAVPVKMTLKRWNQSAYGWLYDMTGTWQGRKLMIRIAHLSKRYFPDGAVVPAGTVVAKTGGVKGAPGSGNSTGSHLHLEIRIDGKLVDPENYPRLILALFNGGWEMTKAELGNVIQAKWAQHDAWLAKDIASQISHAPSPEAKQVLKQLSDAHKLTAARELEASKV